MKVGASVLTRILCERELDRHGLGKALHRMFGRAIDRARRAADMAHLRGHVDDRSSAFGPDQLARDRLRHEKGGAHIQRHHEIEVFDLHIDKRRRLVGAGIVHEDVKWLVRRNHLLRSLDIANVKR